MANKVTVTVKEVRGDCVYKHKVGDAFAYLGFEAAGGPAQEGGHLCPLAYNAIFPYICALRFGADFLGTWGIDRGMARKYAAKLGPGYKFDKDTLIGCCPDPANLVIFEIKRSKADK